MNIDFLIRAANENEKIALFYKTESGKMLLFGSRFFEINPKKKYIIISQPYGEDGTYQQLVRKDNITVFFIEKGFRFKFNSQVLKRDKFKFQGSTETAVLIIQMPENIYDGERRNFFRVPVPIDPPVELKYISYFESNQSFEQQQEISSIGQYDMSDAQIQDISGGGLSMKYKGESGLMVGDIINMKFSLSTAPDDEVQVEGLINNSRKSPDTPTNLNGIEFIPDRGDVYRNAIKKISRYVMDRQRAMLRNLG